MSFKSTLKSVKVLSEVWEAPRTGAISLMHKPCGRLFIEAWETDVSGVKSPGFKYCPHCGKRLKNLRGRLKSWLTGGVL